ncbi:MAG: GNAT family N-acetyltransferase [Acidobacteriota bacterium]|nr:GNAT family N-acetyltransferase [Acidobacteriota bacterium]
MGIALRDMTADDLPAGLALSAAAGWNQLEADWRFFLESPGCGACLAERDGQPAGTVAWIRYPDLAWIAMMLVDPAHRRLGIGSQLMRRALDAVPEDVRAGLDATPLGEPLYRRFGMIAHAAFARIRALVDAAHLAPFTRGVLPMQPDDLDPVLARDREVFGADRSMLLRWLFARAPECAWIARSGGRPLGYCFGRPGRVFHQIGPLVAEDRAVARDLVHACCSRLDGATVCIDVPAADAVWTGWLASAGFATERNFLRMFRAGDAPGGHPALQYAIAGPEFA